MQSLILTLRITHILFGVFWAGAILMMAFFIGPAIKHAGPDGAKVMAGLIKRRFLNIVPAAALLTILSGFWLYWHDSAGFDKAWMGSRMAMALGTGGILALVAFAIGVGVMRPSTMKAIALSQSAAQLPETERGAVMTEIQRLRGRAAGAGMAVAVLMIVIVLTMAVARYL